MKVVLLPGDGIGPEVMAEARRALEVLLPEVELVERRVGGDAIAAEGRALPDSTLEACLASDAVLMGAVGASDYAWSDDNPEDGMFRLRSALDVYANLRPFRDGGIDLMVVRELVGGLYYGERGRRPDGVVYDTCEYSPEQVERLLRRSFELARSRRGRLTSVDKANVLATSRLWRETAERLAGEYPDVDVDHMLVDTAAMRLVEAAESFDVIATENTFGDILSDIAAAKTGGLGMAASACLGDRNPGLFEPVHGTAPDLVGTGTANPTAMLRSAALLVGHGLGMPDRAARLDAAIDSVADRLGTRDRGGTAGTTEFGAAVADELAVSPRV